MDAEESQIFTAIIIASIVIGSIIIYFVVSIVRHQKRVLSLQRSNARAEITALEKDRARIAADLHDELSPILSAVKLKVSSFDLFDEGDRVQQQKTDEHLNDLLRRMREISFDLMPATLQRRGLGAALQELESYWSHRNQLQIQIQVEEIPLSEIYAIHLYRIVQEIVHNTIKHAGATQLLINIRRENDLLILQSCDNGKGFSFGKTVRNDTGFGLGNLRSRTDVLGGELYLETAEGKGTKYTIQVPLSQPN